MARARQGGLGKGLEALFVDNNSASNGTITLNISEIEPNKDQPRKTFSQESLAELADSIRTHGVLQPLLVRPLPNGRYQLIAGERRWRASRMAGISELPVVIREMSDLEAMELALIENLQREDLNPIEEALGYRQLMETCGLTQEKVASSVGKSRPAVANALRLLNLPNPVLQMVQEGEISAGHAKALLALEDEGLILENAQKVRQDKITVREIERLAKKLKSGERSTHPVKAMDPERTVLIQLELSMQEEMGRQVHIKTGNGSGGSLVLEFFDRKDLSDLVSKLTGQKCSIE